MVSKYIELINLLAAIVIEKHNEQLKIAARNLAAQQRKEIEEETKQFTCDQCNQNCRVEDEVYCSKCSRTCCKSCWSGSCPYCAEDFFDQTMPF